MKKLLKDFKEFALKSSAIDMAIGVIIATKFNAIVTALVNLISSLIPSGDIKFSDTPFGALCASIVDFLVCAIVLFLFVRAFSRAKARFEKPEEVKKDEPKLSKEAELLTEIKDLLKDKNR